MTAVKIGIGGPVGSGKTALTDRLCKAMRDTYQMAVVTNDIYTFEDAEFLSRSGALPVEKIRGVQTGGWHWPSWHSRSAGQVPHEPPQPSSPHSEPLHSGTQFWGSPQP